MRAIILTVFFVLQILFNLNCDMGGADTRIAVTNNSGKTVTYIEVFAADGALLTTFQSIPDQASSEFKSVDHLSLKGVKIQCNPVNDCSNEVTDLSGNKDNVVTVNQGSAGFSFSTTGTIITSESGTSTSFSVALSSKPAADVTIMLSSSKIAEAKLSSADGVNCDNSTTLDGDNSCQIILTPLNWNISQSIRVTGVDDVSVDGNISYQIITSLAVSAKGGCNLLCPVRV